MGNLIARIKCTGNTKFKKLLSTDNPLYHVFKIEEKIEYSPACSLEEGQWYVINDFSKTQYKNELIEKKWDSISFSDDKIEIEQINYICFCQSDKFYFQKVSKSRILKNTGLLSIGDKVKVEEPDNRLVLNKYPDALYDKKEDCLYFQKLETISSIFEGIGALYKEATEEDVNSFLGQPFIQVKDGFCSEKVGKLNRRRLAFVGDILKTLKKKEKEEIYKYINNYYPELNYKKGHFEIKTDNDLKILLFGIDQRFYTTPVKKEKRLANSIITIK